VTRRGRNEGAIHFEHKPKTGCKDPRHHRGCTGKWRVELAMNVGGKRVRRRVNARTKTEAYARLRELQDELGQGVHTSATYAVIDAVEAWLTEAMADRAAKTVATLRELLDPLLDKIGEEVLRDLTAAQVREALAVLAATRTTRTVRDTRAALARAITYAQSHGKVGRNVASLVTPPTGLSPGRPSRSLTATQARAAAWLRKCT
jgi:hypothetical protein